MTTYSYFDPMGRNALVQNKVDWPSLTLTSQSATQIVLTDAAGVTLTLSGTDIVMADAHTMTSGTVTGLDLRNAQNALMLQITDAAADAVVAFLAVTVPDDTAWAWNGINALWGEDNFTFGSARADTIFLSWGDDMASGGAGADMFVGLAGDDTVQGDGGRDTFIRPIGGSLTVADFNDTGPRVTQDLIGIGLYDYRHITRLQVGDDVILTFRHHATVILTDYDLAQLDRHDFAFLPI